MTFTKDDTNRVKGVAIILLLFHHCFVSPGRYSAYRIAFPLFPESIVNYLATEARICVAVFTFLSAYGMTCAYKRQMENGKKLSDVVPGEYRHRLVSLIGGFAFIYAVIVLWGTLVMKDERIRIYGTGKGCIFYMLLDGLGLAGIAHTPTYLFTWWYESLAIVIILILPLLIFLYKKCGTWVILAGSFLLAFLIPVDNTSPYETLQIQNYLFCICLGIISADRNLIARFRKTGKNAGIRILKCIAELAGLGVVLELNRRFSGLPVQVLTEGTGAFLIICLTYEFIGRIPVIGRILGFLGIYSGSIYLIHNMIRGAWFGAALYSLRYPALIVAVLLLSSLLISIAISELEKLLHYDKLIRYLR